MRQQIETIRLAASAVLDPKKKGELGQFFTPVAIGSFMASLFENMTTEIRLLDPGAGSGSLTQSFVLEMINRKKTLSINSYTYDIDDRIVSFLLQSMELCSGLCEKNGVLFKNKHSLSDFIVSASEEDNDGFFTHVIMNPPYKKILSSSVHRKILRNIGIEAVNLYSGFVSLAINMLKDEGELVAIIPRSFCNGPYYKSFREQLINSMCIKNIHIFEKRNSAFSEDDVLQENIIIHCIKGVPQGKVKITSSPYADFFYDSESGVYTATDMTIREVEFSKIVNSNDKEMFIHIAANNRDQEIIDRLSLFSSTLSDLNLEVSTGPVVDFRLKDDLRQNIERGAVPLIYPIHLDATVHWPIVSKKPNAIFVSSSSANWLWQNRGCYVITKRLSSKEEKKRITATYYDSHLPSDLIGFENKLNVFHNNKSGVDELLAKGLYIYLNSSLVDKYYRQFGGHTQINATDLRALNYPSADLLCRMGTKLSQINITQSEIDAILDEELNIMHTDNHNPLHAQEKITQALDILNKLGMPRAQQNERSALTFLALLNLVPKTSWERIERPMIGVTPIMDWVKNNYGKEYAPNTRETFRRQTLHQFVDAGICLYNPDEPSRAVNSPKACYQIALELYDVLQKYNTQLWDKALSNYLSEKDTLVQRYAMEREMQMIPLILNDGTIINLSAGAHSQLIKDIITDFGPRFVPGAELIYLGDTGSKVNFFKKKRLEELGVKVNEKGKLPDVVLYWEEKDWLILIESVTSHGPVDGKRHNDLSELFKNSKAGLVYVTAFPDRRFMGKYLSDISWETEVWTADAPTHMIHFNGVRFLGPY
ncbi:Eco57I restriction-modification methylase domain-containing protein [Budviciaceae bacterium CWB-B4]|uniref:site-specific DNA-methyltransferase (adenine-specific) n=1 Tax=Limnobaculum xujianqingii TaxID=2738837 RepID=A0A9D7AG22_9GAMM|nr:Eco57I restriction-modification methylase domain-containing protein [Limnobaculum xujianqingii]MBK5175363.1 Eco57I restriction-modification methylase domain-containing protein [Limnobaculum xujianqingii]